MGPTWGPHGADRTQVGPMLVTSTLSSGIWFRWPSAECMTVVTRVREQCSYCSLALNHRYIHVVQDSFSSLALGQIHVCPRNRPLARYVKLLIAHAPAMPGTFSPPLRVSDPEMHHSTCVTHVSWCIPGSLTSDFLWRRWRGKCSRHSWRMCNPQFYVSGKRPMEKELWIRWGNRLVLTTTKHNKARPVYKTVYVPFQSDPHQ